MFKFWGLLQAEFTNHALPVFRLSKLASDLASPSALQLPWQKFPRAVQAGKPRPLCQSPRGQRPLTPRKPATIPGVRCYIDKVYGTVPGCQEQSLAADFAAFSCQKALVQPFGAYGNVCFLYIYLPTLNI